MERASGPAFKSRASRCTAAAKSKGPKGSPCWTPTQDCRVAGPYFSTKPGSIETNPILVVEVSNVKLISI
jgi:hypothetical protein